MAHTGKLCWHKSIWNNDCRPISRWTSEVGSYGEKSPHPFGLTDMAGNVWQWCSSQYEKNDERIVYRGGSWCSEACS